MAKIIVDMDIGEEINRLTLLEKFIKDGKRYGKFQCSCPAKTMKNAMIWYVAKGQIKSCGCIKREKDSARFIVMNYKHGRSDTVEHNIWMGMKSRCYNVKDKNYIYYGGRGIKICKEWLDSFTQFYEDLGPRPSKDYHVGRIKHNRSYEKNNCRWTNEEMEKIDRENNLNILAFNKTKTLLEWSEDKRCKVTIDIIKYRLWILGWDTEKAIKTIAYEG